MFVWRIFFSFVEKCCRNFFTHWLHNIISTSHWVWAHILIVPYIVSHLSYSLCHSTIQYSKVQRPIYFGWNKTNNFILLFIDKKWFYFSLFIFWHTTIPPSFRMHATSINSLLNSLLNAFLCLNLLHQVINQNNYYQDGGLDLKSSCLKRSHFSV